MKFGEHLRLEIARLKNGEEWSQKPSGLAFLFFQKGDGSYIGTDCKREIVQGDLLVLPEQNAGKVSVANGSLEMSLFSVCLEQILPLLRAKEVSRVPQLSNRLKAARLYPASSPVTSRCRGLLAGVSDRFDLDHKSQLLCVAAAVLSEQFTNPGPGARFLTLGNDQLPPILQQLTEDDLVTLSVSELAAKCACSRRQLNRLFHQFFGRSALVVKTEVRLLKAISLLRDPELKVIEAAESSGFHDLGMFNHCFKQRFGVTPGEWRKRDRGDYQDAPKANPVSLSSAHPVGIKAPAPVCARRGASPLKRAHSLLQPRALRKASVPLGLAAEVAVCASPGLEIQVNT